MKRLLSSIVIAALTISLTACSGKTGSGSAPALAAKDTDTAAVSAVLIASNDIPADDIHTLVSTIFENKDTISEQHSKGNELDIKMAASMTSVPYHPGAAAYYKEKGIDVSSVASAPSGSGDGILLFGTGGESGTYFAYGGVLSSYVSGNTGLDITALSSGGSQANIEDMDAGLIQLGFVQSDVMTYAANGERLFDKAYDGFSVVAALYMEQIQIVTTDPSITSVADLKGRAVSIGAAGSGVYFNALDVLGCYGLSEDDIKPVYQSFGDSAESLKDRKIDAAFIVAGAPTTAITDLAAVKPVYLISLDKEHRDALLASSPFYSAYTIPGDTY